MKITKIILSLILFPLITLTLSSAPVLDFERINGVVPFEGMIISTNVVHSTGMSFTSLDGTYYPIIAKKGRPGRLFLSNNGLFDTPLVTPFDPGDFFFGDPTTGIEDGPKGFVVTFESPVSMFSLYIIDLDQNERATLIAYDQDSIALSTNVFTSSTPGFGDARSGFAMITNATKSIKKVQVKGTGDNNGANIAFDSLSSDYTPPAQAAAELTPVVAFRFTGTLGTPYRIDYADTFDLTPTSTNWHEHSTIYLEGTSGLFFDTSPTIPPNRFYRAVGIQ